MRWRIWASRVFQNLSHPVKSGYGYSNSEFMMCS
jgi:hypothetical protein